VAGGPLGLLFSGPSTLHLTVLLKDWTDKLTLFLDGQNLPHEEFSKMERRGIRVVPGRVAGLDHKDGALQEVRLQDGAGVPLRGLFAHPRIRPSALLHEQVGAATRDGPLGPILEVGPEYETSVSGVFAAGDLVTAFHNINGALYAGTFAGVASHRSLLAWD
jgi:thioredoxin reductase